MANQRTLSTKETLDFLNEAMKKEPYKMRGHSFTPLKGCGKSYCKIADY